MGAAWNEREHQAYGIPFPAPADRMGAVEETLTALQLLEAQESTDFAGDYLSGSSVVERLGDQLQRLREKMA